MKLRGGILPKVSHFYSSIHGDIDLFQFAGKETLRAGGVTHSGGFTYDMWKTAIASFKKDFDPKHCLVLGIGGGTIVKMMQKSFPNTVVTAVDIDPVMIKIAKEYFSISTEMIEADALLWIEQAEKKFDIIITDLYKGRYNPRKSRTYDFLKNLNRLLKKNGQLIYNSHYNENDPKEFETFLKNCKKIFGTVEILREYEMSRLLYLS